MILFFLEFDFKQLSMAHQQIPKWLNKLMEHQLKIEKMAQQEQNCQDQQQQTGNKNGCGGSTVGGRRTQEELDEDQNDGDGDSFTNTDWGANRRCL